MISHILLEIVVFYNNCLRDHYVFRHVKTHLTLWWYLFKIFRLKYHEGIFKQQTLLWATLFVLSVRKCQNIPIVYRYTVNTLESCISNQKRPTSDTFPKKPWTRSVNGNKWTVASWRLSRTAISSKGFSPLLDLAKALFRVRKHEISKQVWSLSTHCTAFYCSRNESVGETFDTSSLTIICVCKPEQNMCKQFTPF